MSPDPATTMPGTAPTSTRVGRRSTARRSAISVTDVVLAATSGHIPAAVRCPVEEDEERGEADASDHCREHSPSVERTGVRPRGHPDGRQRQRDADQGKRARAVAECQTHDHGKARTDQRRNRGNDRHSTGGQSVVETRQPNATAKPCGSAPQRAHSHRAYRRRTMLLTSTTTNPTIWDQSTTTIAGIRRDVTPPT